MAVSKLPKRTTGKHRPEVFTGRDRALLMLRPPAFGGQQRVVIAESEITQLFTVGAKQFTLEKLWQCRR